MMKNKFSKVISGGLAAATIMGVSLLGAPISNAAAQTDAAMASGNMPMAASSSMPADMMNNGDMQKQCTEMMKNADMQVMMKEKMKQPEMQAMMKKMMAEDPAFKKMMTELVASSKAEAAAAEKKTQPVRDVRWNR